MENTGEEKKQNTGTEDNIESSKCDRKEMEDIIKEIRGSGNVVFIKNMNFLKNNTDVVFADEVNVEEIEFGSKEKQFGTMEEKNSYSVKGTVFETEEMLMNWMAAHYNDFEMAFLITLAVFEGSPYLWVYEMTEELFESFEMEESERQIKQKDKEKIPAKKRIKEAGAGLYTSVLYNHMGLVECEFIRFIEPEYAKMVLKCVWEEFIFTREILIHWLQKYVFVENYSKADKAVSALAELARLDYYYFDKYVIRNFLSQKNIMADFASAQIMIQSYECERYKNNIETQMKHWATLGNFHYSLAALMICTMGEWDRLHVEHAVKCYIKQVKDELQSGKEKGYLVNLSVFFEIGGRKAVYFKSIVSVLYQSLTGGNGRKYKEEKKWTGLIFLILLQIDYDQSNVDLLNEKDHKDMIFVRMCFIENENRTKLLELWRFIWKDRSFRTYTRKLLELYLYQYGGCGQKQLQYLRQFLYGFQETEKDCEEMEFFLRKITFQNKRPVKPAGRIHYQLDD